jgi:hypothetical protein
VNDIAHGKKEDIILSIIISLFQNMQVGVRTNTSGQMQVAPITGNNKGLQRAEIKQGIREVITCKDADGKIGLRLRHVNNVSVDGVTVH